MRIWFGKRSPSGSQLLEGRKGKRKVNAVTRWVYAIRVRRKRPGTITSTEQVIEITEEIRMKPSSNLQCSLAAEETSFGSRCETPIRRRKMRGIHHLVEPSTHPRRPVRSSKKSAQITDV
ncbi:hypothetical protein ACSQ67_025610 [Phaseolus vulgaris]